MKYVMVTNWDDHWDKIGDGASYSFNMLRGLMSREKLEEHTPTIFIKLNKDTKVPEKAWDGEVHSFDVTNRIHFKFKLAREIEPPKEYEHLGEGWHIIEERAEPVSSFESKLSPPFFRNLLDPGWEDYDEFEEYCFLLLKLVGIHEIHRFTEQSGKSDGFFRIRGLTVVYDATLRKEYEAIKREQINNYCAQMKRGVLEFEGGSMEVGRESEKQVWIITKGRAQVLKRVDDVTVKEVPVKDLIQVYFERIQSALTEGDLSKRLVTL